MRNSNNLSNRMGVIASALLTLFAAQLFAQSDLGSITGYVNDPSGAVLPNAAVTVKNESTGVERKATTNQDGLYSVTNIPSGYYSVTTEVPGFKRFESTHNKLDPNATLRADVALQVGQANETVEVVANAQALQTDSASVQSLISRNQINSLELNGRNPIYLANLLPGVRRNDPLSGLNFGLDSGGFNINGGRSQDNLITFDGAPAVRTRSNGTSIGVADVDSTQEIQVLTADYAAEYRSASGGQIRIVTKSGTSQFHGNLFEYFRNNVLNANSWARNNSIATKDVAPFRYNQYGYNIGGPAYIPGVFNKDKNKFFFFWGQEWLKYRFGDTATLTVPSAAMRTGNFSELLDPNNVYYGHSVQVLDPLTKQPFSGNIIPQNRLSPNGLALLNAYPVSNTPFIQGNKNWLGQGGHTIDQRKDTLSADMYPGENHHVSFHRQNYNFLEYQPLDGGSDRTPKFFIRPNQTNSLNYVWTISPTMVNEAMASVSVDDVYIPLDLSKGLFDRTKYGIDYPYIFPGGKEVPNRIPTIKITNFNDLNGGPYPSHSSGPIYDVSDNLTKVAGNHTVKFGILYERSGENDFDQINVQGVPGGTNNQNGQFGFTDGFAGGSGVAAANAALGLFDVYSEIGKRSYTIYRGSMWEWFAQDQWKISSRLTVTVGLRHTINIPFEALWRNMDVFDPHYYDPSKAVQQDPKTGFVVPGSGDPYNGIVIPGNSFPSSAKGRVPAADSGQYNRLFHGLPAYYSNIHYGQFQPRLGIAWQLNPKTVVRAGGGRFFTRLGVSDSIFLGGNSPFQPIASVSNGNVDNPGGSSLNQFPLTITSQDRIFKNPEAYAWNFTYQREIFGTTVEAAYIGRRGLHSQRERDINQLLPGTLQANPGTNPDYLRQYKGYSILRVTNNDANSIYNSLQLNWNKRFASGFGFGASYTLSKSSDDGSSQRDVIPNAYDAHNMWGPSAFDSRHVIVINYVYDLPFFHDQGHLTGKLLGGWQISGVTQAQTGTPATIGANIDYAGVGEVANIDSNPSNGNIQFWNINGSPKLIKDFASSRTSTNYWFATTNADGSPIFTAPAAGAFATGRVRNRVYGPGFQNWNLGLFKKFLITEQAGFEFRAEAFNFINHPNGDRGSLQINPLNQQLFGKLTSKTSERNLQLSLRFSF